MHICKERKKVRVHTCVHGCACPGYAGDTQGRETRSEQPREMQVKGTGGAVQWPPSTSLLVGCLPFTTTRDKGNVRITSLTRSCNGRITEYVSFSYLRARDSPLAAPLRHARSWSWNSREGRVTGAEKGDFTFTIFFSRSLSLVLA